MELSVSPSPHIKHNNSTQKVMMHVLIALIPAFVWGVVIGGVNAVVLTLLSVTLCVLFELAYELLMKKPVTVSDLSAAVTGVLLAFNVPSTCKWWVLAFGCFFAIVIVKQLFGGIGKNIVNPAIAARIFMFVSWPEYMTGFKNNIDTVSSATPLTSISAGIAPKYSVLDAFLGNIPGCIGEVSALLLIIGGLHLIIHRIITPHIPLSFIATVVVIAALFPQAGAGRWYYSIGYQVFSGGLMLGAIFMATDYTTSPVTPIGRIIYGVGCGLLTMLIRYFGAYAEGVSFAIMIMNLLVWYIEKATAPKVFGSKKPKTVREEAKK